MAKIKNVSGEDRLVPALGGRLVLAGATVDVDAGQVTSFTQQEASWAPSDAEATELHQQMLDELAELLAPADDVEPEPAPEPDHRALVADVIPGLDAEALAELHGAELARSRPRKSVLDAITARAAEINELGAQQQDPGPAPDPDAAPAAGDITTDDSQEG